jgi:hypothetical protein
MWLELLTAGLYYMPFVVTIAFAGIVFLIGLTALISGTVFALLFAAYGVYAVLRDFGFLSYAATKLQFLWRTTSDPVVQNLKQSFVLEGAEKIPSGPALYLCQPHGVVGYSWFFHFSYGLSAWPEKAKRPVLAIHSLFFRLPFAREILQASRCIEASEPEILKTLASGQSVALVVGGVEEMTYAGGPVTKLVLKKRKGFVRIAKKANVPIVPVYTEGESDLFDVERNPLWKWSSDTMRSLTGVTFPLPSWTGMKTFAQSVRAPLDPPVKTFVVGVVETHHKEEVQIHKECLAMLTQFFKQHSFQATIVA